MIKDPDLMNDRSLWNMQVSSMGTPTVRVCGFAPWFFSNTISSQLSQCLSLLLRFWEENSLLGYLTISSATH